MSYTARGLLADLLSRPDGWREDGRHMADSSPQGRAAIRRAIKELMAAGYYWVVKVRIPDGTIRSEVHVFDTPQLVAPDVTRPGAGRAEAGGAGALSKNPEKEPTLPADGEQAAGDQGGGEPSGRAKSEVPVREDAAVPDEQLRAAVATLFRVIRPEPRLRLGEAEALALAPLVARWVERGSTADDLARALLPGLPVLIHSSVGVLRSRLERKMPPVPVRVEPSQQMAECAKCHDPVARPGICRLCAGLGARVVAVGGGARATSRGVERARAAMRAGRNGPGMGIGRLATAE
ncbi:hypothetical protein [Kitasatospora sp. GP82]|uniref:hypothetical protein n=1 Tax=Kitasatospora sp. GP82 TaxID=3035089 RepID=UPI0024753A16|nr:hypothetical protein [Kitasatospora sp. GP82]